MTPDELDPLLAEQVAYYRARAAEYDETSPVPGDDASRGELEEALESFAPRGQVLEFACGTGQWTTLLARHASELTALDASPEMLAVASSRVPHDRVRFIEADLFTWQPDGRYDPVFFSAWLSHVPPQLEYPFPARGLAVFLCHRRSPEGGLAGVDDQRPLRSRCWHPGQQQGRR
jgi:2-polyprenyl-3-methyl-5-hydroxy-6-metoxy-1,4-benzoquinol methylase